MKSIQFPNRFETIFRNESGLVRQVRSTPVASPKLLIESKSVARELDFDFELDQELLTAVFSGNQTLPGMSPIATRYGGHQFGHWAGQLGDGRAILLGELVNEKGAHFEIQLKGAGLTPFSRRGDGRAVLRSSLREFLCSEAMHYLKIPTTRALCCVTTGEAVVRDMFYDGNPVAEPGAITTRVAPSFLRLGHFQILYADQNTELMAKLKKFTIDTYFKGMSETEWFNEVCARTARLMVDWMRVGFVHGVMNTDNLSVLGLTIDYGPYGWMDIYDPSFTPNTTDFENRRYRYAEQPKIAFWNLTRFAESLGIEIDDHYIKTYNEGLMNMMAKKLGLDQVDYEFVSQLDETLQTAEIDMTIFYRSLPALRKDQSIDVLEPAFYSWPLSEETLSKWNKWIKDYLSRVNQDSRSEELVVREMNEMNPYFILRNFLVQEALDDLEKGDRKKLDSLMKALETPYEENEFTRPYFRKLPDWARDRPGCSALSCSS